MIAVLGLVVFSAIMGIIWHRAVISITEYIYPKDVHIIGIATHGSLKVDAYVAGEDIAKYGLVAMGSDGLVRNVRVKEAKK